MHTALLRRLALTSVLLLSGSLPAAAQDAPDGSRDALIRHLNAIAHEQLASARRPSPP